MHQTTHNTILLVLAYIYVHWKAIKRQWSVGLALWMAPGPVWTRGEGRKGGEEKCLFLLTLLSVHLGRSQLRERTLVDKNASDNTQHYFTRPSLYLCTLEGKQRQWSVGLTLWMAPGPVWTREEGREEGEEKCLFLLTMSLVHLGG